MKIYAVRKGHKTGIFKNWADCQAATKGFSSPEFKSFNTLEEAEAYLQHRDLWVEQVAKDNNDGYLVAFVDGSYEKNINRYSYGVYFILPDGSNATICNFGNNIKYIESCNIIGEIFGVINALDWAISNGYEKIKIYHDYEGLSKWITGEWTANAPASRMYVNIYKQKFEGVLQTEFIKVPSHSNVTYNEEADKLAKSALSSGQKVPIQGENWFSMPYFKEDDVNALSEIITESDGNIVCTKTEIADRFIYKFCLNSDSITVTLFKNGQQKLLVQGKPSYLFQVITTTIVELDEKINVEQILGSAYRITIKADDISDSYNPIIGNLPANYPPSMERLIKQSIINLKYYVSSEDYSQYVFPALRALEGHIKFLITEAGGTVGRQFNGFNKDSTGKYTYTASLPDATKKQAVETCYNYYKSQRDTIFHFGDILGSVDNTRTIQTKHEADEIIQYCIQLINTQR